MRFAIIITAVLSLTPFSLACAADSMDLRQALDEALQMRAEEFAPEHFAQAQTLAEQARSNPQHIDEAYVRAQQAAELAQKFSQRYADLVDSRDRMLLAGKENLRADLAARAEKDFAKVVVDHEHGNIRKADREAGFAHTTIHAAQVVAARKQFVSPVSQRIAEARKLNAPLYAPSAFKQALDRQKKIERLIKENPDAQSQAYAWSKTGQQQAERAIRIARLGSKFNRDKSQVEQWLDASDARLKRLATELGLETLPSEQTPDEQLATLLQAATNMKRHYNEQLADANQQLAKYEGELSNMSEMRRKLQLKREAEEKIKQITALFNPDEVKILLTPDADVILRLSAGMFKSGSSVIPPAAYDILDNMLKTMAIFPDRNVRIEGHTDSVGASEFNQSLSERRANAVKVYFQARTESQLQTFQSVGYGETRPIANNETAEGRARNRRIDIILPAPDGKKEN